MRDRQTEREREINESDFFKSTSRENEIERYPTEMTESKSKRDIEIKKETGREGENDR